MHIPLECAMYSNIITSRTSIFFIPTNLILAFLQPFFHSRTLNDCTVHPQSVHLSQLNAEGMGSLTAINTRSHTHIYRLSQPSPTTAKTHNKNLTDPCIHSYKDNVHLTVAHTLALQQKQRCLWVECLWRKWSCSLTQTSGLRGRSDPLDLCVPRASPVAARSERAHTDRHLQTVSLSIKGHTEDWQCWRVKPTLTLLNVKWWMDFQGQFKY